MDELEVLKAITEIIRQARAELAKDLSELDRLDLAKVVPKDYQ